MGEERRALIVDLSVGDAAWVADAPLFPTRRVLLVKEGRVEACQKKTGAGRGKGGGGD
jgi:hypothetical protein